MPEALDTFTAFRVGPETPKSLGIDEVSAWSAADGELWVHLDRTSTQNKTWLSEQAGLYPHVVDGLLDNATRPRLEVVNDGMFLTLRGVNLNEGANPADMISLRIWVEPHRIITLEREPLRSIVRIAQRIQSGQGPQSIGALLVEVLDGLTERMGPIIDGVSDRLDELEDLVVGPDVFDDRSELLTMRQQVIKMHRYLRPQAEVVSKLRGMQPSMLDTLQQHALTDINNQLIRYVEDLESSNSRMVLIQDELSNQYAERLNNRMYAVTMVATILLPMTIFTGLLGINVDGIPGAQSPYGFLIVCVLLLLMGLLGYWIVRKCKWL